MLNNLFYTCIYIIKNYKISKQHIQILQDQVFLLMSVMKEDCKKLFAVMLVKPPDHQWISVSFRNTNTTHTPLVYERNNPTETSIQS